MPVVLVLAVSYDLFWVLFFLLASMSPVLKVTSRALEQRPSTLLSSHGFWFGNTHTGFGVWYCRSLCKPSHMQCISLSPVPAPPSLSVTQAYNNEVIPFKPVVVKGWNISKM